MGPLALLFTASFLGLCTHSLVEIDIFGRLSDASTSHHRNADAKNYWSHLYFQTKTSSARAETAVTITRQRRPQQFQHQCGDLNSDLLEAGAEVGHQISCFKYILHSMLFSGCCCGKTKGSCQENDEKCE